MTSASSRHSLSPLFKKICRQATRFSLISFTIVVLNGTGAHAQSMDYGALEQLFGEPVTTSATGSPQRVSDVPVDMVIVTADDIRRSGARDIPGVLRHVGGLDLLQWTNDQADVGIRGYAEAYTHRVLVLVDGRQVYADHYGYTPWTTIPVELSAIRQIEIVKGPASALFGFNAVDGVINIVTYNPLYDDAHVASVTGGTQNLVQGSLVSTYKSRNVGIRLMAGGFRDHDFTTPIPPTMNLQPRLPGWRGAVDADVVWKANDKIHFELSGNYAGSRIDQVDPDYLAEPTTYKAYSVRGRMTADAGSVGLLQLSAYSNWTDVDADRNFVYGHFHFDNRLYVLSAEDVFKLGANHTFRVSTEYRQTQTTTTSYVGGLVGTSTVAVGGMWEWKISPTFTLTNAVRFDHMALERSGSAPLDYPFTNSDWKRAFNEASFNSGIVWRPDSMNAFRLTMGRAVHTPNLTALGGILIDTPFLHAGGAPTVKPSPMMNYEIGWDRELPSLNAKMRASIFYEDSHALMAVVGSVVAGNAGPFYVEFNAGNSRAAGAELGLSGRLFTNWRWGVDLRYESIRDRFVPAAQFLDFEHVNPKFVAKVNLGWSQGPWEIDTYLHVQSHSQGLQPAPLSPGSSVLVSVPTYANLDARIAYRVTDKITLAVSSQDILKSPQVQTSAAPVERRVLGTVTINVP